MYEATNRRAVLRGLASIPAMSSIALASVDPVYEMIARHRVAYAARMAAEAVDPNDERARALYEAEGDTFYPLIEQPPATLQGLRASTDYLSRLLGESEDTYALANALSNLAEAAKQLIPV